MAAGGIKLSEEMSDADRLEETPPERVEEQLTAAQSPAPLTGGLYATSNDALKAVRDDYLYWTGKLTEASFQLSVGIIAANWAVFGTKDAIIENLFSRGSISVVVLSLGISLIAAKVMGEAHLRIIEKAESDLDQWQRDFVTTLNTTSPWPFTVKIDRSGRFFRGCRLWFPLAGGLLFLLALWFG